LTGSLRVEDLHAFYGLSHVLHGVSLEVAPGEVVLLLGRNGAGKTTLIRSIMGMVPRRRGRIAYGDREIIGWAPHRISRLGIGLVPEDRRMFARLSVRENLELGCKPDPAGRNGNQPEWNLARVFELFPALALLQDRKAGTLSGGQQQMVAIARTLMGNPALLLLDEPAEGLAPVIVDALADQLKVLRKQGLSMLISEQNLGFARALADRAYVMEGGAVRYSGTMTELAANTLEWSRYIAF
jgi:branched-chain amino acid transport system ATP-binding protein